MTTKKYFKSVAKDGTIGTRETTSHIYQSVLWCIQPDEKHVIQAMSSKQVATIGNQKYLESLGCHFYSGKCEEITKEEYLNIKDFNKRKHLLYKADPFNKMFA